MRPKTLIISTAGLVLLHLALIAAGLENAALAQERRPSVLPPTSPSPVIARVPAAPPASVKPDEETPDRTPKEETSAQIKMRRAAIPATNAVYDVGVIPGSESCPAGSDLITIYMDDEDHQNASSSSGWIGAIVSNHNTKFVFCRVDGTKFGQAAAPYAVLQLSPQCPPMSFSFNRYFDNEDSSNRNGASGTISPNSSSFAGETATQLFFCLFTPDPQAGGNPFPDLGIEYGVFASSLPASGLASGRLHTDDEDTKNENFFDTVYQNMGTLASQIISGDRNTDISIVKVKDAPPAPPHCLPKVLSYNGSLLSASYDGANCYIKAVVSGATPFIWNGGYYVTADKSTTCLPGTGSWDTANSNCFFMPKPLGGFLYSDAFYVTLGPGDMCPPGTTFDTANCLVKAAPWGTHAFEYQNKWYFTTQFTCKDGSYDAANCYVMKAPAGVLPFIYNNAFYYKE